MAGCSVQSRPFTAQEASDAVVGICNLGLEHWPARWPDADTRQTAPARATSGPGATMPEAFLLDHDLVTAFEVGWAVLHEDVSMFVAERLIVTLRNLRCADAEIKTGLGALKRELAKQRAAGTPWRARGALDVLAMLDTPAWASLVGLLDECPVLPAALTATLERQLGAVSATARFERSWRGFLTPSAAEVYSSGSVSGRRSASINVPELRSAGGRATYARQSNSDAANATTIDDDGGQGRLVQPAAQCSAA
jgi:hypothetical protein